MDNSLGQWFKLVMYYATIGIMWGISLLMAAGTVFVVGMIFGWWWT